MKPGTGPHAGQNRRGAPATPVAGAARSDERLTKRVATLVPCSRREAEQYIEGGWVSVNGCVVEEPMYRVADHNVEIDRSANLMELQPVTLLLHKPAGYDAMATPGQANRQVRPAQALLQVATHATDDTAHQRVLQRHLAKLTACVPLETPASGLVVFTQDWRVLRKLGDDAALMEQEMIVEVTGEVSQESLLRLNQSHTVDDHALPAVKVSLNSAGDASSKLRFAIKGSHPGLIAYLCERVNLQIVSIKRQRIGRVALTRLPEGQWRYLQAHERF